MTMRTESARTRAPIARARLLPITTVASPIAKTTTARKRPTTREYKAAIRSIGRASLEAPTGPLDDPAADGVDRRLDAVLDLQLHEDVRDVVLDRLRADVQRLGDLRVVLAVRDQAQHLELAVRELGADSFGALIEGDRPHALEHLGGDRR